MIDIVVVLIGGLVVLCVIGFGLLVGWAFLDEVIFDRKKPLL